MIMHDNYIDYIQQHAIACDALEPLATDAGSRSYYRIHGSNKPLLLAHTPAHDIHQHTQFRTIANHLHNANISAPHIYHYDDAQGLAIIEDFGQHSVNTIVNDDNRHDIYIATIDMLIYITRQPRLRMVNVAHYTKDIMLQEANLLLQYYAPYHHITITDAHYHEWATLWHTIIDSLRPYQPSLMLRDVHVDNIFYLPSRGAIKNIGVIDFQDALLGPPAFDMMSLLEDARMAVPDSISTICWRMMRDTLPYHMNEGDFEHWYNVSATIRHAKVLGLFIRLATIQNKTQYMHHIPHVEYLMAKQLDHDLLRPIAKFLRNIGLSFT